jgi:hypothetical protein
MKLLSLVHDHYDDPEETIREQTKSINLLENVVRSKSFQLFYEIVQHRVKQLVPI